jgi:NADH:ubiquinone oxidoreductase subunit E
VFSQASHNSRLSAVAPVPGDTGRLRRIAELIQDLKPDDADLLKGLHRIQHEFRYIPREGIPLLAAKFNTAPAIIYGTIDFYSELRQEPPATNVVEWCSGPACRLKNSMGIRRALEAQLGCAMDQKSIDGQHELRLVQCDGTCHLAPLVRYEGRYIGPLETSDAIVFARELVGDQAIRQSSDQGIRQSGDQAIGGEPLAAQAPGEESGSDEVVGAPAPGAADLTHDTRETELSPRPPVAPDADPTREPGE